MKYGILFLICGLQFAVFAWLYRGWAWLLMWPAVSFSVVGLAYLGLGPGVFGKQPSGRLAVLSRILLAPYLLYYAVVWRIVRLVSREDTCNRLTTGVWIGRRTLSGDLPAEVEIVVDLTCEMSEPSAIRRMPGYRSCPILDGTVADADRLVALIDEISAAGRPVYIHCGQGRTSMFGVMWLIRNGLADSSESALKLVQACRPSTHLKRVQQAAVQSLRPRDDVRPVVDPYM